MANILTDYIPKITSRIGGFAGVGNTITYVAIFILFATIAGISAYFIFRRLRFNNKIVIFEKINGRFEPSRRDRASVVKFGTTGDSVFYLAKAKKYLPTPTIQTGRRTFWYVIKGDGEWINIGLEDIDERMKQAHVHFVDADMRYARVALQRNLRDRYDNPSFFAKYGFQLIGVGILIIVIVFLWLITKEIPASISASADASNTAKEVLVATKEVIGALDNLCGGSGLR